MQMQRSMQGFHTASKRTVNSNIYISEWPENLIKKFSSSLSGNDAMVN